MTETLTLVAALLLGLVASGHCVVMCGGISAALGVATAKRADGTQRRGLLIAYQLGRVCSYATAGLLLGGLFGGIVRLLDLDVVRHALRALTAVVMAFAALVAFGVVNNPRQLLGRRLWERLAPLGRRLLPIANARRAFAFGMVWGWMPCGFVYSVLLIATLQLDALHAAATMLAFGLGTAPAMLATAFGAGRVAALAPGATGRRAAGIVLTVAAAVTLAAPVLADEAQWLHACLPFGCATR